MFETGGLVLRSPPPVFSYVFLGCSLFAFPVLTSCSNGCRRLQGGQLGLADRFPAWTPWVMPWNNTIVKRYETISPRSPTRRNERRRSSDYLLNGIPSGLRRLMAMNYGQARSGTVTNVVTQYYHRVVVLQLVDVFPPLILDIESVLPEEDEVAAALRIVKRLRQRYPRFLDVITFDALYLRAPFVKAVRDEKLDVVIVLKQENRELYQDVEGLLKITPPLANSPEGTQWWDIEGLTSWAQLDDSTRVIRSLEPKTKRVRVARQWKEQTTPSDWRWVTSLAKAQAPTEWVHRWGHEPGI